MNQNELLAVCIAWVIVAIALFYIHYSFYREANVKGDLQNAFETSSLINILVAGVSAVIAISAGSQYLSFSEKEKAE